MAPLLDAPPEIDSDTRAVNGADQHIDDAQQSPKTKIVVVGLGMVGVAFM